ncbi:uncharacterized protein K489DRAFT_13626 [Dissoconium aciculare CBS 342.82]|uniref:Uncharacterized protein n=1 Tax=Dissoconium aciculare CBS 342.82 TaxID=1314786 RepID=A0A6J3MI21_9PEZI|nr:uncharacterized protein K489DRAFT_13626 [Dissoconium aciculare CBS 342.82]KAF1827354.1 hypothetical protein K489DRAFT_13626 [Dissoconium aciculare CBS 342.82]
MRISDPPVQRHDSPFHDTEFFRFFLFQVLFPFSALLRSFCCGRDISICASVADAQQKPHALFALSLSLSALTHRPFFNISRP